MTQWKVEVRTTCKMCGGKLPNARFRTFCSTKCRNKSNNIKQAEYNAKWQKKRRDKIASKPSKSKCQCLVCGKWYIQVCSHVQAIHKMTGREYREKFELEVKKGVVPKWYKKKKGKIALQNKTFKNLKAGEKYRFKKGQEGVGVYQRSPITLARLKNLYKFNKKNKKNVCKKNIE